MTSPDSNSIPDLDDPIDAARRQFDRLRARAAALSDDPLQRRLERGGVFFSPQADSIPGYVLHREIHRGGQGVVFQASQASTGRIVAVKITRQGPLASRHDLVRLEREAHILGRINHPNIVGVIDSGSSGGSRFFVMDYIHGRPLDEYAADLPRRGVLELFALVCEAVHAAHLHGVIHRDLKPANILVDAEGRPRILDFGLAKASPIDADSIASQTAVTVTGQFMGSLPWASPEQAAGGMGGSGGTESEGTAGNEALAVDLRSDVYSLGVILFQLLTRSFPYRVVGSMRDVLDNIINAPPAKPSSLDRRIDHEVETIILRCLDKVPERRYQSAGDLASDLRRYLAGEPIDAKRDSLAYVLRKRLRRHRVAAAVSLGFILLVAAGLVVSLSFWRAAARERDEKENQRRRVQAVNDVLHNMLASADPDHSDAGERSMTEVLAAAAADIDAGSLRDHPDVEASVRLTIGEAYLALGRLEPAEHHLAAALALSRAVRGQAHPDTALCLAAIGRLRDIQGDQRQAVSLFQQALSMLQDVGGPPHPAVPEIMLHLARGVTMLDRPDEARALFEQALAIVTERYGPNHPQTARYQIALATHRLGADHGVELRREALAINRATLGPKHPEVARSLRGLAGELHLKGRIEEAERTYLEALSLFREIYGDDHPEVILTALNLAWLYDGSGQKAKTVPLFEQFDHAAQTAYGRRSLKYAEFLLHRGDHVVKCADREQGVALLRQALEILIQIGGDQTWQGAECRLRLAEALLEAKDFDQAERFAREVIAIKGEPADAMSGRRAQAQGIVGEILTTRGEYAQAEPLLLASYEDAEKRRSLPKLRLAAINRLVRLYQAWEAADPAENKQDPDDSENKNRNVDSWRRLLEEPRP